MNNTGTQRITIGSNAAYPTNGNVTNTAGTTTQYAIPTEAMATSHTRGLRTPTTARHFCDRQSANVEATTRQTLKITTVTTCSLNTEFTNMSTQKSAIASNAIRARCRVLIGEV